MIVLQVQHKEEDREGPAPTRSSPFHDAVKGGCLFQRVCRRAATGAQRATCCRVYEASCKPPPRCSVLQRKEQGLTIPCPSCRQTRTAQAPKKRHRTTITWYHSSQYRRQKCVPAFPSNSLSPWPSLPSFFALWRTSESSSRSHL